MARFIENHDENRAANVFGKEKSLAAATVIMTLPGLRFIYEGQVEGKKIKLPVQLKRGPDETADKQIITCYKRLLAVVNQHVFHNGEWHIFNAETSTGKTHPQILSWYWRLNEETVLVLINYGAEDTQAVIRLPEIPGRRLKTIRDLLTDNLVVTSSTENELNLSFKPWQAYFLSH
jgi:glycosidase